MPESRSKLSRLKCLSCQARHWIARKSRADLHTEIEGLRRHIATLNEEKRRLEVAANSYWHVAARLEAQSVFLAGILAQSCRKAGPWSHICVFMGNCPIGMQGKCQEVMAYHWLNTEMQKEGAL